MPLLPESAVKHTYNAESGTWSSSTVSVVIEPRPFAEGSLRRAHRMYEVDAGGGQYPYVAKASKVQEGASRAAVYADVKAQMVAEAFAQEYNKKRPTNKVAFVPAYALELQSRPEVPMFCVEPLLEGQYHKHNNNDGAVNTARLTPQAFSHFTYVHSDRLLLVCDIQGVRDMYTDPQIHTRDGQGFGLGNCGMEGIERFLATHRCNDECRKIGLPSAIQPPTLPATARGAAGQRVGAAGQRAGRPGGVAGVQGQRQPPLPPGQSTLLARQLYREEAARHVDLDRQLAMQLQLDEDAGYSR
mmetsp:Transcript_60013/g.190639  ORF Transcript_60013/g.190639 Transcript_60013/m.190639 type:complete len:300 (+) Transcript_60013:94-993(+)|eukprot:CAMPEP_0182873596 /NCGR_PEP_ID=MMETSP0034_2-20130328/12428_1 /TAXON_ID=156128 /ORGANISM="Nephroselmis pyriformis, Strain CCMP717" /LENGTH=299 /DNA_ID=CAMNT_0025006253 /DNA_START=62 /DNA_END=961 /DNA_ORIENTATION=-